MSPHDSTGANLIVQVKNDQVMRVVPLENEDVNECWIADRDRFSYEALNGDDRLTQPMLKQGGQWQVVDWQTALEYVVANGLRQIKADHGAASINAGQPAQHGGRTRARHGPHARQEREHRPPPAPRRLHAQRGRALARHLDRLVVATSARAGGRLESAQGPSAVRATHPPGSAQGAAVHAIANQAQLASRDAWAMPLASMQTAEAAGWGALAVLATAVAAEKGVSLLPMRSRRMRHGRLPSRSWAASARPFFSAMRPRTPPMPHVYLALAQWIGEQTGTSVGYLTEAANTVGAQWVGALPGAQGLDAGRMLARRPPGRAPAQQRTASSIRPQARKAAPQGLDGAQMVVTLSPFKANLAFSDVLLPISPFSETPGTFVNAEGRIQASMRWSSRAVKPSRMEGASRARQPTRTHGLRFRDLAGRARARAQRPRRRRDACSRRSAGRAMRWLGLSTWQRRRLAPPQSWSRPPSTSWTVSCAAGPLPATHGRRPRHAVRGVACRPSTVTAQSARPAVSDAG